MYLISAQDNGYYYFNNASQSLFCPKCDSYIGKEEYFPKNMAIRKLDKDFSYTYDNRLLLSKKAVDYLINLKIKNITFKIVNKNPKIFTPIIDNVIKFDSKKRKTRFENLCKFCGNYESIIGLTPVFLHKVKNNSDEFCIYKTDISFGSGREKSPVIIISYKLAILLQNEFNEIDLHKAQ